MLLFNYKDSWPYINLPLNGHVANMHVTTYTQLIVYTTLYSIIIATHVYN